MLSPLVAPAGIARHKGQRRRKGHLKSGSGCRRRRPGENDQCGERDVAQADRNAVEQHCDEHDRNHYPGSDCRDGATGNQDIEEDHEKSADGGNLLGGVPFGQAGNEAQQRPGANQKGTRGEHHVKPGDRKDMREAGRAQCLDRPSADRALLAGHERGSDRTRVATDRRAYAVADRLADRCQICSRPFPERSFCYVSA